MEIKYVSLTIWDVWWSWFLNYFSFLKYLLFLSKRLHMNELNSFQLDTEHYTNKLTNFSLSIVGIQSF